MRSKKILVATLGVMPVILACGAKTSQIDPTAYPITPLDQVKVEIPDACRLAYENAVPKVAVVDFANNSTFDLANAIQTASAGTESRKYVRGGAWGVGVVGPGVIGVGGVSAGASKRDWRTQSETISRQINAKIGESVAEAVVSEVASIGGMKVYTRRDLQKVLEEQKLQMSGLIDPNTAVQIGQLAGVKYIITGAVNNVNLKWVSLEEAKGAAKGLFGTWGSVLAAGAATQEGWNVIVDVVIKVIDTETGEVVLSKTVSGREVMGKTPQFSYDSIIGGIKKAVAEAVEDIRPEISKLFPLRGYIIQLRTAPDKSKRYALINVGAQQGVKSGQEFYVIDFQAVQDPISGRTTCDQVKLPVSLVVSNQIQTDKAWAVLEGDKAQIMRVKLGQIVERKPLEGGSGLKKLF
ncbi:Curli production assembly/transport component CsgG [Hydrogenivirga caldilitoris]|uniref:Curli production assembly/transport component CsgG n=1 Tax=Hydrogenivirga caldilitoris TaxID=246264 RepID=A0A497XTE4_9AQUI|nr:CsgG/HfaB family protein [Hydrogenivirga caldilitoris]RLJ70412.1 Curli production assembly/transport component CsgG [Hydrogenivirga caldilitoris]